MSKIDFSKIAAGVLAKQQSEKKITEYKIFFKTHLITVKNRQEILAKLYPICIKFQNIKPLTAFYVDNEKIALEIEAKEFLTKYFNSEIIQLYQKEIPTKRPKNEVDFDKPFWVSLLQGLSTTFESLNEKYKEEWNYKTNFLIFLNNCLHHFGLHPDILNRNIQTYKRYNFILEHFFKSKVKIVEYKTFLNPQTLKDEYLQPYENKLPIKMNGKLIPFKSVYSIKITSTLLLDDEIELYSKKNNFIWNNTTKEELKFINFCQDETETLHKNPFLLDEKEKLRNQNTYFVNPIRIQELKSLKGKTFDLLKLIRLCEELNTNSSMNNNISSSLLVRSIIDHIPPVFNFANFSELANNYADGTRSFKKSMLNLDKSLRNIADNNIHSQIRKKEVLPTSNQSDFSPELDLLLSEIVRKLK